MSSSYANKIKKLFDKVRYPKEDILDDSQLEAFFVSVMLDHMSQGHIIHFGNFILHMSIINKVFFGGKWGVRKCGVFRVIDRSSDILIRDEVFERILDFHRSGGVLEDSEEKDLLKVIMMQRHLRNIIKKLS